MFAVASYAALRRFVFVERHIRREAARVFGPNRETVAKPKLGRENLLHDPK
jgi:hypothetical protein